MKRNNTNELNERQRVAIAGALFLEILTGERIPNRRLYEYANNPGQLNPRTLETYAANYNQSQPVNDYRDQLRQTLEDYTHKNATDYEKRKAREKAREEGKTDFTDRDQFIQFLNETANNLTNEKDKRDYLKMIADLLRLKEDTPDKSGEIMKFYTPVSCSNCQIKAQFAKIRAEKGGK